MKLIKAAAAVLNQTALDWHGNKTNVIDAIDSAREQGVTVLCLPEMCITGYGCEDAFHSPGVLRTALAVLDEIVPHTSGMIISVGLPLMHGGAVFNTACLIVNGEIAGFVGKQNLAGEGIHYEPRWFKPWPEDVQALTEINGKEYPLGDVIFDCGGVLFGFEICEDAWVGNRPGARLARRGVDIILNPSASHFAFGKHEIRKRFVLEGSRAFHVNYIYANLLGNEAGRAIYDGDAMIAAAGNLVATGPRFSFADVHLTTAVLDVENTRMTRARTGSFSPDITEDQDDLIKKPFTFPSTNPERATESIKDWESGPDVKAEEFARAVSLGLFDYMRKSRSQGVVVSLSGGADSATVATMAALMVRLGVGEIGRPQFVKKLQYVDGIGALSTADEIIRRLTTCVYQSTRNSSDVTRDAAQGLSEALGAEFLQFDVDHVVQNYVEIVSQALNRELDWQRDDVALQNIQARARAPGVWMLANINGALLLSTSNRSEAAVGYATMDGDTSGGLAPIAGIDKAYLRAWLRWMEATGPAGVGPVPALNAINCQQPTAELRPQEANQTDEDDLMPYEILDWIERAAIRDKKMPLEIFQQLEVEQSDHSREQLALWVERFFRLWSRNQWKRERYAPSFHLDDENLDPKTWCRFPILSGGFERELAELDEYLKSS